MQKHLEQASHNLNFHQCIEEQFTDNFFDWKITTLFYIAVHWLKALSIKRGHDIGDTHIEIDRNVNPNREDAPYKIPRNAWRDYKSLQKYSHTARYEGITDPSTFQKLMQNDHQYCLQHIERFKKFISGQGLEV